MYNAFLVLNHIGLKLKAHIKSLEVIRHIVYLLIKHTSKGTYIKSSRVELCSQCSQTLTKTLNIPEVNLNTVNIAYLKAA